MDYRFAGVFLLHRRSPKMSFNGLLPPVYGETLSSWLYRVAHSSKSKFYIPALLVEKLFHVDMGVFRSGLGADFDFCLDANKELISLVGISEVDLNRFSLRNYTPIPCVSRRSACPFCICDDLRSGIYPAWRIKWCCLEFPCCETHLVSLIDLPQSSYDMHKAWGVLERYDFAGLYCSPNWRLKWIEAQSRRNYCTKIEKLTELRITLKAQRWIGRLLASNYKSYENADAGKMLHCVQQILRLYTIISPAFKCTFRCSRRSEGFYCRGGDSYLYVDSVAQATRQQALLITAYLFGVISDKEMRLLSRIYLYWPTTVSEIGRNLDFSRCSDFLEFEAYLGRDLPYPVRRRLLPWIESMGGVFSPSWIDNWRENNDTESLIKARGKLA